MSDDVFTDDDVANAEDRMRQATVRWIADQKPGPFLAYFTSHGEGWIVTDRERPAQTRIATVSTDPDDYGRANTLMIADALNRAARASASTPDPGEPSGRKSCPCTCPVPPPNGASAWCHLHGASADEPYCEDHAARASASSPDLRAAARAVVARWLTPSLANALTFDDAIRDLDTAVRASED